MKFESLRHLENNQFVYNINIPFDLTYAKYPENMMINW